MDLLRPLEVSAGFDLPGALRLVDASLGAAGPPLLPLTQTLRSATGGWTDQDRTLLAGAAAVLSTSGSSGTAKSIVLDGAALVASAQGTHRRLGGSGQWLLCLPPQHVAGFQVLVRSVLAGADPVPVDLSGGFTARGFATALAAMHGSARRYAALVPTQLARLLADPAGTDALEGLHAVLVGGAALPAPVRERLAATSVRAVTTYGMTESAGGCVYDGRPLDGVQARADEEGRLHLGGPVLARGYLGRPELTAQRFWTDSSGTRWYRTDDIGRLEESGLRVLGRVDDVINTGGVKVVPGDVEDALLTLPWVAQAQVLGLPDPQWGERVAAVLVLQRGAAASDDRDALRATVREALRGALRAAALPHQVVALPRMPLLPSGKPDRVALRGILTSDGGRM